MKVWIALGRSSSLDDGLSYRVSVIDDSLRQGGGRPITPHGIEFACINRGPVARSAA
jgi:hypothetical protein